MAGWLLPAVKLILPHVTDIVKAAKPAFTKLKGAASEEEESGVVQKQIAELQASASQNATHIKELAEQLRLTVSALEQGASEAEKRMKRAQTLAVAATALSIASLGCAAVVLLTT
jgi:hypothetical protein